jgi:hypothetical protein
VRELLQADQPDRIAIGAALRTVHGRLSHDNFAGWLAAELGISDRTAARYMAAGARVRSR